MNPRQSIGLRRERALLEILRLPGRTGIRADDLAYLARTREPATWLVNGSSNGIIERVQTVLRRLEADGLVARTRGSRNRHIWRAR